MKRQCLAGYQQNGRTGVAKLTSPTQRATWHPSTDKRVFLGALGSTYEVAKPWWSPRPRRIAWRRRLADSGPGYRPKAALSPTDSALAQPGHGAESQAAKGPGDATHIHAPVNRTFNLRPNCKLEAVLWPAPSPILRWLGVTPAGPGTQAHQSLPLRRKWQLQYSHLGNPKDKGAWWATVHGLTKNWTWLSTHHQDHHVCECRYS